MKLSLNLIVKDGLKKFKTQIQKIKNVILYIKSSAYRYQDFNFFFYKTHGSKNKKISLDTDHGWNTTYFILHNQFKIFKK